MVGVTGFRGVGVSRFRGRVQGFTGLGGLECRIQRLDLSGCAKIMVTAWQSFLIGDARTVTLGVIDRYF